MLGFVLLLVMATFDYRFLKVYAGFIYGATLVGLLLLRIPGLAASETGTSNYIDIPGVSLLQISPSEFAKIGLIVILAAMLSELRITGADGARPRARDRGGGAHDAARLPQRRDRHDDRAGGDHGGRAGRGRHPGEASDRARGRRRSC